MSASADLTDAAGTVHGAAGTAARIVCLVPSITELLCELGLTGQLVGRTGFCIHPREALRAIAKVGGTKDVDLTKVRALRPTHVIVNVDENRKETVAELAEFVPHIVVTHPLRPSDNLPLYRLMGGLFAREEEAEHLCGRYTEVDAKIASPEQRSPRRVLYLIWREPWMTVTRETYIAQTLARFNWHTVPAQSPQRYPEIALEDYVGAVDCVLLSTEPFPFKARHVAEIQARMGVGVRLIDGEMTSWYGSRAIEGLRYLDAFTRTAAVAA
ncbi:MAG: cobalamin-binding protein [Gammaproteobacteria bacterium]|nr:cobalamin-binding protein [Gammaproteobacteria bacterium]